MTTRTASDALQDRLTLATAHLTKVLKRDDGSPHPFLLLVVPERHSSTGIGVTNLPADQVLVLLESQINFLKDHGPDVFELSQIVDLQ